YLTDWSRFCILPTGMHIRPAEESETANAAASARHGRGAFLLAAILVCGCSSRPSLTDPAGSSQEQYGEAFDIMWNAFDSKYPYFDYKQIDWNAIRAQYRSAAASAATTDEFLGVVRSALAPLRDEHAWLEGPNGLVMATYQPTTFTNWD